MIVADHIVVNETKNQIFDELKNVPKNKVGLLLGTAKFLDKARHIVNPYYQYRIDAAAELYMSGKIDYIIVSGDDSPYYSETKYMMDDLIAKGVPAKRIYRDNAGFRTLDSILRCRDIFGQQSFTVISQRFHNERAMYIANHKGIRAVAYDAKDGTNLVTITMREKPARIKMMLDLLLNKQAKLYGDKVIIK